jgi:peptide/nickel transport system substrate-binding protein
MMKKVLSTLSGLLVLLILLTASGCGPAAGPQPTTPPKELEATAPLQTAAPSPTEEEQPISETEPVIMRIGWMEEPDCLHNLFQCELFWYIGDIFWEGFTALGPGCNPIPRQAKSMEMSEDGLTWTIHLQDGITWSDGEPFDASDVVDYWNWNTSLSIAEWHPVTYLAESWKAIDEHTFQLTTSDPVVAFERTDALWHYVLPMQIYGDMTEDEFWAYATDHPVTTGPYILSEWDRGSHIIFDARPEYWGGKPPIDRVVIQFYANPDAMVNALLAGEIDVIPDEIPPQFFEELAAEPNLTVIEQDPGAFLWLDFNMSSTGNKHPALDDPKVREAIDRAIDKQQIVDVSLFGKGIVCPIADSCGPLFGWHLNPASEVTPYDPQMANQILDEAGYLDKDNDGIRETPDGEPLTFRLFFEQEFPPAASASTLVGDFLSQIGIGVDVTAMESGTLWEMALYDRDFDLLVRTGETETDPATDDFDWGCWAAEGGGLNIEGYCNPELDDLIFGIATTSGPERLDLMYEVDSILAADRPFVYLAGITPIGAYRNDRFEMPQDACPYWEMLMGWYPIMNTTVVDK